METIKIQTLGQLKALKVGTKLKLVEAVGFIDYKSENLINKIVKVNKLGFELSYGTLRFPDKKSIEFWDNGFIVKKGINTSIPTILKYEVIK